MYDTEWEREAGGKRDTIKVWEIPGVHVCGILHHFDMRVDLNVPLAKITDFYNITVFITSISAWLGVQSWSKPHFARCWTNMWPWESCLIALMALILSCRAMHWLTPPVPDPRGSCLSVMQMWHTYEICYRLQVKPKLSCRMQRRQLCLCVWEHLQQ